MSDKTQIIYINLDDSGALNENEKFCIYGGVLFYSKKERDKFITQYRGIVNKTKHHYCKEDTTNCGKKCGKKCPELKNSNLKAKHKRELINYIKQYETIACIIRNENVYPHIKGSNSSRRRYTDYAIRRAIKEMLKKLIVAKRIDPNQPVKIILNMDQQSTKSNGYYALSEGIKEELLHGISNFNYSVTHKPILFSTLDIDLQYLSSATSYVIQASDLVAGTVRRTMLYYQKDTLTAYQKINFITYKIKLP